MLTFIPSPTKQKKKKVKDWSHVTVAAIIKLRFSSARDPVLFFLIRWAICHMIQILRFPHSTSSGWGAEDINRQNRQWSPFSSNIKRGGTQEEKNIKIIFYIFNFLVNTTIKDLNCVEIRWGEKGKRKGVKPPGSKEGNDQRASGQQSSNISF